MKNGEIYFVSGIDTDIGKSYATGYIARLWNEHGRRTITQKFIQTGNTDLSEDILRHRAIAGTGLLPEDRTGDTMPEIFSYPASPLLASRIDSRPIDFGKIEAARKRLQQQYDAVLVEGAGGLMVPLTEDMLTIDYVQAAHLPLILVTSGRLGSINHTLLSLEAIRSRGLRLSMLAYNLYPECDDELIRNDTREYLQKYLSRHFPQAEMLDIPVIGQ